MTPFFFPSTWIPESVRCVLFACFKQVTVLQPARKLVPETILRLERGGRLDIRLPDEGTDEAAAEDLPNLLGAYHAWADLHRGERPDFHKFAPLIAPGPEDASTAWIRSKIRGLEGETAGRQSPPNDSEADLLKTARLFLAVTQEYDQQDESLSMDLRTIHSMERHLLQELSPDQPTDISARVPFPPKVEAGRPMPVQRLAAWRRLYIHCRIRGNVPQPPSTAFFVTDDQEALDLVLDTGSPPEVLCRIVQIPAAEEEKPFVSTPVHERIYETLLEAVHCGAISSAPTISFSEDTACRENTGKLIIYRIKGDPVTAVLPGSENTPKSSPTIPAGDESLFTLLGYIST